MTIRAFFTLLFLALFGAAYAQDSGTVPRFSVHFQQTVIGQYHPSLKADYRGENSLKTHPETDASVTATLFAGMRLWKGAAVFVNPELAGGSGFSSTLGIAGFPNGETFRVGSSDPKIYFARAYVQQTFGFGSGTHVQDDDLNQLAGMQPDHYLTITAGKFGLADFFDDNTYSHDPRTEFMNWSLMSNAAWDYPANTRGYVWGAMAEYGWPGWAVRLAGTMLTTTANGSVWDEHIGKAFAFTAEADHNYTIAGQPGTVRLLGFYNQTKMGDYRQAIAENPAAPDIESTRAYGRHKTGFGINAEQALSPTLGLFAKASYNDGHAETWAFTEIDRSVSAGLAMKGDRWNRKSDVLGIAAVVNGLSAPHRDYLAAGGYGFMIGDGKLNYAPETIGEIYYSVAAYKNWLSISPGYQFILHPAYNADRGPVHVFSLRAHISI
ncbi:MAG: carbohydrate porin [Mucilaginibacter polytrichastri]|nr:carbohydrate porin [Mucilaginibacter polytrichastri]